MSTRIALALALCAISVPAVAQQDVEGIIKRLQAVPASSTQADCDKQLAKAAKANAFDLFYGSGVCQAAKQKPEASFLLLAGQIRAMPDMGGMVPATQNDAKTVVALYGFIYSYAGGMGDDEVLRDKISRSRLYALIDQWKPAYDATYHPGWATRGRPSEPEYRATLDASATHRRQQVVDFARLYSDDTYYALHHEERELYAKQGGTVDVDSPIAKRLGELARQMNERAVALGVRSAAVEIPSAEAVTQEPSRNVPPEAPGSDERIIDGAADPVAKRCVGCS